MKGRQSDGLAGLGDLLIDAAAHPEIAGWFAVWDTILPRGVAGEPREPLFPEQPAQRLHAAQSFGHAVVQRLVVVITRNEPAQEKTDAGDRRVQQR